MEYFVLAGTLFMLGASLSSATDCALWKIRHKQSWIRGRSICEGCKRELRWWEIIPVWSALFLRGTCPRCGYKFGVSRSLTEAAFGLSLSVYILLVFGEALCVDILYFIFYGMALLLVAKMHLR